jgi:hypothetical protein
MVEYGHSGAPRDPARHEIVVPWEQDQINLRASAGLDQFTDPIHQGWAQGDESERTALARAPQFERVVATLS